MHTFDHLPYDATFTPAVVSMMTAALSDAWLTLTAKGIQPAADAEPAVREILARGIIQTAELGERSPFGLRDAALAYYLRQSPLVRPECL